MKVQVMGLQIREVPPERFRWKCKVIVPDPGGELPPN